MCHHGDIRYAETCVASIRYWNKKIPIYLHKDTHQGEFDTSEIENRFNVSLCDSSKSSLGSILSPLAYILLGPDLKQDERIFVQDADILWLGDVIPKLQSFDADLLVSGQFSMDSSRLPTLPTPFSTFSGFESNREEELNRSYFDPDYWMDNVKSPLPDMVFNAGHYVYKVGSLSFADFEPILKIDPTNKTWNVISEIRNGDQGALNLVASKKALDKGFLLQSEVFSLWPKKELLSIDFRKEVAAIAHWAGLMEKSTFARSNGHVWRFYRKIYYQQFTFPSTRYFFWCLKDILHITRMKSILRQLISRFNPLKR